MPELSPLVRISWTQVLSREETSLAGNGCRQASRAAYHDSRNDRFAASGSSFMIAHRPERLFQVIIGRRSNQAHHSNEITLGQSCGSSVQTDQWLWRAQGQAGFCAAASRPAIPASGCEPAVLCHAHDWPRSGRPAARRSRLAPAAETAGLSPLIPVQGWTAVLADRARAPFLGHQREGGMDL